MVSDGLGGGSEDEDAESREPIIEGSGGPSRRERLDLRRRRSRRVWSISIIGLALAGTASPVAGYVAQRSWVRRTAVVHNQSCHPVEIGSNGGGGASDGTFRACNLAVSYLDASGHSDTAHLTGVESARIHGDTVDIYFSSSTSRAVINPQDRIPSWAFVLLGVSVWFVLGLVAIAVYPRRDRIGPVGDDQPVMWSARAR